MDLRQLDNLLKDMMPQSEAHRTMDRISHWLERLKSEKTYETGIAGEMKALKNMERMGLVLIKDKGMTIEASMTENAQELYKEMVARGFFLKTGKV